MGDAGGVQGVISWMKVQLIVLREISGFTKPTQRKGDQSDNDAQQIAFLAFIPTCAFRANLDFTTETRMNTAVTSVQDIAGYAINIGV